MWTLWWVLPNNVAQHVSGGSGNVAGLQAPVSMAVLQSPAPDCSLLLTSNVTLAPEHNSRRVGSGTASWAHAVRTPLRGRGTRRQRCPTSDLCRRTSPTSSRRRYPPGCGGQHRTRALDSQEHRNSDRSGDGLRVPRDGVRSRPHLRPRSSASERHDSLLGQVLPGKRRAGGLGRAIGKTSFPASENCCVPFERSIASGGLATTGIHDDVRFPTQEHGNRAVDPAAQGA